MNDTKRPVLKWGRLREELTTNFHFLFSYANRSIQFSPRITSSQFASQATWNNREMTAETRSIIFRRPPRYPQRFGPLTTVKKVDLMGKEKWVFSSLHCRPKTPEKNRKFVYPGSNRSRDQSFNDELNTRLDRKSSDCMSSNDFARQIWTRFDADKRSAALRLKHRLVCGGLCHLILFVITLRFLNQDRR